MNIKNNIYKITQNLPTGCKLIAVSKTKSTEQILEAYDAGHRRFGENKVQELVSKYENLPKDIEWHMIGHLQSNKVKFIAPFIHLIHSIDSVRLLNEVNKQAEKAARMIQCLLQVHIASEETKFGFSEEELFRFLLGADFKDCRNVEVIGLMGMATMTDDTAQITHEFSLLKTMFEKLKAATLPSQVTMQELSMGMSSDFSLAVESGSTMVRVGSSIFGERN